MSGSTLLEDIFAGALAQPVGTRPAYLDEACRDEPELRVRVDRLLAAHEAVGSFLERPPAELESQLGETAPPTEHRPPRPFAEGPGSQIGPYKLLEQIGEGGMGVVYMAEQQKPVRRRVALKIIKPGMDSKQVIARFEAERQALALMDHAHIARVLDAGTTESGHPYFVMELVRGVPITAYCDQNQLPIHERLALLIQVCHAVQHAHQKGIIHRDLKPSNVLVTLADGRPVPKVIDFGVAKATSQQLTEKTLFTNFSQMIGTPLYMSPEQAEMTSLDIDTRSDVYSLGVLLYELLTGTTPFDLKDLRAGAYEEIRRIIRESEPPRPSTRISTLGATRTAIAAHRQADPERLSQLVRGELDWIVMKALEKDRGRRYGTATDFARDIQRYLSDEPVEACPPSALYRLRKYARRHRTPLLAAALIAVAVLVGLTTTIVQTLRARQALALAKSAQAAAEQQRAKEQAARKEADQARVGAEAERLRSEKLLYAAELSRALSLWKDGELTRGLQSLGHCPVAQRGWEHDYLYTLMTRGNTALEAGHEASVHSVAYSPDGRRIALGLFSANEHAVQIWDVATQRVVKTLTYHDGTDTVGVSGLAFSPDGRRLAGAIYIDGAQDPGKDVFPPGCGLIWDVETGQSLFRLVGHRDPVNEIAFSPDGRLLATVSNDLTVRLWSAEDGKELHVLKGHKTPEYDCGAVCCVTFSPDGKQLASGGDDQTARVWDVATGSLVRTLAAHENRVTRVRFTPDGRGLLTASYDQTVKIWNLENGQEVQKLAGDQTIMNCALSPDGRMIATGPYQRGLVDLWDLPTGRKLGALRGHVDTVHDLTFSPDGRTLATGSQDGTARLWDLDVRQEPLRFTNHQKPSFDGATFLDFSRDGQRLVTAATWHPFATIWNSLDGRPLRMLAGDLNGIKCLALSPDDRWIAGGTGNKVKLWDATTGKTVGTLDGHTEEVSCLAFSRDGRRLASGSQDKTVRVWDLAERRELLTLNRSWWIETVNFSPDDQKIVASGSDIVLWNANDGSELARVEPGPVRRVKFSPDGKWIAASRLDAIKILDATTLKELHTLSGHTSYVRQFAISPDGRRIASLADDRTIRLWSTADWQELLTLKDAVDKDDELSCLAFSPDGRRLASGSRRAPAVIWDATRRMPSAEGEP